MNVQESEIQALMARYKKFTVYGLSPDTGKPSYTVPAYMREHGWQIKGTYPKPHGAGGFDIFEKLSEIPTEFRKFVDVFRSSERIPQVVDEVLAVGGVEVLWLQLGISNPGAEKRAEAAGLKVVSNRCLVIEHRKWF